jgi:hypothetical protein
MRGKRLWFPICLLCATPTDTHDPRAKSNIVPRDSIPHCKSFDLDQRHSFPGKVMKLRRGKQGVFANSVQSVFCTARFRQWSQDIFFVCTTLVWLSLWLPKPFYQGHCQVSDRRQRVQCLVSLRLLVVASKSRTEDHSKRYQGRVFHECFSSFRMRQNASGRSAGVSSRDF